MLFVISRKRVYLGKNPRLHERVMSPDITISGHYWEDVSFGKKSGSKIVLQYDEQVTNFLESGFQAPDCPGNLSTPFSAIRC